MENSEIRDLSSRLKEIAQGLSFLGHPRFPLKDLLMMFPQHHEFIQGLEDVDVPFPVDVDKKRREMDQFIKDLAVAELSFTLKKLFSSRIEDYRLLLTMMENFGREGFYAQAVRLYGTSHELRKSNSFLYFLDQIPKFLVEDTGTEKLRGDAALLYLRERLAETFPSEHFDVKPSSSLLSDSSAGRRVLKLNPHKEFSKMQLEVFLVHEGWAHLGTSLNGAAHKEHLWLSTWSPRTTHLQEGLAVLTELITGCMTKERWERILLRHLATTMAEKGSSIVEVYNYLRHQELNSLDAFKLSLRVFRGVPLEGGAAFTKELLYLHGLIELLHLIREGASLESLWAGKMSFEEHAVVKTLLYNGDIRIEHFPAGLLSEDVKERLRKLKGLSLSF